MGEGRLEDRGRDGRPGPCPRARRQQRASHLPSADRIARRVQRLRSARVTGRTLAGIPNPIDVVTDAIGAGVGWAFDEVAEGIAQWVLGAVEFFVNGAIAFQLGRASCRERVGQYV